MGAKLRISRRRKISVTSTKKITRAMELVATSRIAKAQARLNQARPYAQRISEAIEGLAGVTEAVAEFPLLTQREEVRTVGILLVTSDRGLAGAYNTNVIRVAENIIKDARAKGQGVRLHVVGKKGITYFRFRQYEIASEVTGISDQPDFAAAQELGRRLTEEFVSGAVDQVRVVYTDFRSAGSQVATSTQVLPIHKSDISAGVGGEGTISPLYEFEPGPGEILSLLLPRYVNTIVFAGLLESSASEHAARRRAMKAATENANDLIKVLDRIINRERQTEITTEIMEVVGGAEALRQQAKASAAH